MKFLVPALLAAATAAVAVVGFATPSYSSAFVGGHVIDVAGDGGDEDVLYARQWPAPYSRIIGTYEENDNISLTGRCKNTRSNRSFYIDGPGSAAAKFSRMRAPYVWCQVMTPTARLGWVRGRFVWPQ